MKDLLSQDSSLVVSFKSRLYVAPFKFFFLKAEMSEPMGMRRNGCVSNHNTGRDMVVPTTNLKDSPLYRWNSMTGENRYRRVNFLK